MNAAISPTAAQRAQRALGDGSALRVVGRAHLQVDHADQAWAAQQALEDGLNTADFADCGRLIVVRSLRVRGLERGLATGARGPAFARAIEAAWRALAPSAVAFDAPAAASAPAVYFRSASAARLAWLQRVAGSQPVDAWFWRSALPELAAASPAAYPPAADALAAVIAAVLANLLRDEPPALAKALLHWPAPALRRLLAGAPMQAIAAGARWPIGVLEPALTVARRALASAAHGPAEGLTPPDASMHAEAADVIARLVALAPQEDEALAALATLMLAPGEPSSVAIERVAMVVVHVQAVTARQALDAARHAPGDARQATPATAGSASAERRPDRASGPAAKAQASPAASHPSVPLPITALPAAPRAPASQRAGASRWPWLAGNEPTAHGGLLMLLNVLRRMEIDAWLQTQAPTDRQPLVALLFETLADRLRLPPDDPQRALFAAAEPLRGDTVARQAVDLWLRRLRRTLRLQAHIGPASLVRRDAGIAITATHVDVVMPLHGTDLRLRRAGLDSDPGWLPWFGWIVKLHYVVVD